MLTSQAKRRDGLLMLLLGSIVFVVLGAALERVAPAPMVDFRVLYVPARCLVQQCDPYNQDDVLRVYRADGSYDSSDSAKNRQIVTQYIYPPSAFSISVPFALLPWVPAAVLWTLLTVAGLILASYLVWTLGANYAPILSGCLIGFMLANSELLVIKGMSAGIAVSLCAVAVWCFHRQRFAAAGILCLAVSLALKPQDTGFVWLYLLLAGGLYRKRALQTLLATIAISLPSVLWVWRESPHWMQEFHANLVANAVRGGLSDPGLTSTGAHGLGMVISLQAFISVFWDDPRIYNPASYLICGSLLLLWAIVTLRARQTQARAWLALAAIAALSMLPVYHRQYDAKLLLLSVPACAMLWAEGGVIGWLAVLLNTAAFLATGDLSTAVFLGLVNSLHPSTGWAATLQIYAQVMPAPLILLAMSLFYLWAYLRRDTGSGQAIST